MKGVKRGEGEGRQGEVVKSEEGEERQGDKGIRMGVDRKGVG